MGLFSRLFGKDGAYTIPQDIKGIVLSVNDLEESYKALTNDALKNKSAEFRARLSTGETVDDILPDAFAAVRESARRVLRQRHYDVQLIGGVLLHRGTITEMKTGEGKTLVATLPVYLNALVGKGVHVITVNDYLSRRDTVWMGQVYQALGMSVACVNHDSAFMYDPNIRESDKLDSERDDKGSFHIVHEYLRPVSRKQAYDADITYGTNNEFGFDYLRDNIARDRNSIVQREHHFAIVDEVDSVLIDEARTPLIISAQAEESGDFYKSFARIASQLHEKDHYEVDEKMRAITLTDAGITRAEKLLGVDNIYTEKGIKYVHHLETAVRAQALFRRDKEYVVSNGEVIIVDEFTGRMMPGRRWSDGLHQAVEAKEGVHIQQESRTFASITYQNYFRMYTKLSGMTGTAITSSEEFHKVYGLEAVPVPTHKPLVRDDKADLVFQTESGKFKAVVRDIKRINESKQPILVGTISIEKSEYLSALLSQAGVRHTVLNAKQHESEGEVIAQAGRKGGVTIATNMAGRGVDIVLGGNPRSSEQYAEVRDSGGLYVIGTERHEARRIDDQLRGRSGRQGDPGTSQFYVSMEDDLMRVFGSEKIKNMMGRLGIPEDQPIENRIITNAIGGAQEKIEGFNFDSRKHVLEYDDVINKQRNTIYARRRSVLFGSDEQVKAELLKVFERQEADFSSVLFSAPLARKVMLQVVDMLWVDHLELMDYTRSSVRLRAYGQRDPLVEYKNEGVRLFKEMEFTIDETIVKMITQVKETDIKEEELRGLQEVHEATRVLGANKNSDASARGLSSAKTKTGRNDPCPCGSGKKYKKCHGK